MGTLDQKLLQNQIIFELVSSSPDIRILNDRIISLSQYGPFKNVLGKFGLMPPGTYSFTFKILNAFTCEIGIVSKLSAKNMAASIDCLPTDSSSG